MTTYFKRPIRISQMWPQAEGHQHVACILLENDAECLTSAQVDDVIRQLRECQQRARKGQ